MLSLLAPTRNSAIAFDIGITGVRACQLASARSGIRLVDTLDVPVVHAIQDEAASDRQMDLIGGAISRIERFVGQAAFHGTDVSLVLSPPEVRYQTLHVADGVLSQPESRVLAAIKWEASRERRCEPDDLEVRYWRLPLGHQQNVMAMSILKSRATGWFEALARAGLSLKRIDGVPNALTRLGLRQLDPGKRDLWATLDIGARRSLLTLVVGETPTYVRALPNGSGQWIRAIAQVFETSETDAAHILRTNGIRAETDGGADVAAVAFAAIRDSLSELIRQVELCFSYVVQNYAETQPVGLLLTGGGGALNGLDEYLALHIGVPVRALDPAHSFKVVGTAGRPIPSLALAAAILDIEGA